MKTFQIKYQVKSTVWHEATIDIEANTEEEAQEKCISLYKEDKNALIDQMYCWDELDDSLTYLTPEQNGWNETECFAMNNSEFINNCPKELNNIYNATL